MELSEIRKQQRLTQEQVANQARIARAYYTQIENGQYTPSVDVAKRIANTLGFDWTDFYPDKVRGDDSKGDRT